MLTIIRFHFIHLFAALYDAAADNGSKSVSQLLPSV